MFVCRIFFFHLYESPRYLVHAGRPEDAVYVLQQITKVNGSSVLVELEDVHDKIISGPGTVGATSRFLIGKELTDAMNGSLASRYISH